MRLWLAHLIFLPLAAWALITVFDFRAASNVALWLVGAVIVHDFIILPLYSAADRAGRLALPGTRINYVRIPAGLSLLAAARLLVDDPRQGRRHLHARQRARVGRLRHALAARHRGAVRDLGGRLLRAGRGTGRQPAL